MKYIFIVGTVIDKGTKYDIFYMPAKFLLKFKFLTTTPSVLKIPQAEGKGKYDLDI